MHFHKLIIKMIEMNVGFLATLWPHYKSKVSIVLSRRSLKCVCGPTQIGAMRHYIDTEKIPKKMNMNNNEWTYKWLGLQITYLKSDL